MELPFCSGAVLAGGFSSRMGRDKAALPFGGMTLLEWQVQKLRALGIADIMVSGSRLPAAGTRYVPDVFPHRGPLSGIHACLQAARGAHVLVLGVDIPLVPVSALRALLENHTEGITALCHGGAVEPLLGVYAAALAAEAEQVLQSERPAVRRLMARAQLRRLDFDGDARLLVNCNTPDSYSQTVSLTECFHPSLRT